MNQTAFETEVLPHVGKLRTLAFRLTRNLPDAEDLLQDTLLRAFVHFDKYQQGTNAGAWLARVMHNHFINKARAESNHAKRKIRAQEDESIRAMHVALDSLEQEGDPERNVLNEWSPEILAIIETIPAIHRRALLLCDVEGHTYQEIAEREEIPLGTVMSRIWRGRNYFKRGLKERGLSPAAF